MFEAAVAAGVKRLVYASSVAAYGFHADNPRAAHRGASSPRAPSATTTRRRRPSWRRLRELLAGTATDAYVFRPCIVAGPDALTLVESIPYIQLSDRMPAAILRALEFMPVLQTGDPRPRASPSSSSTTMTSPPRCEAAVLGRGEPGVYNLAGRRHLTIADLADALGWYCIPVPDLAVDAAAELVARLPFVPDEAQWIDALREPVIMDTTKAHRELGWRPKHDARSTVRETIDANRLSRLVR